MSNRPSQRELWQDYFAVTAFTAMCFVLTSSPFGSFTVSTPLSNDASDLAASISTGRVNER